MQNELALLHERLERRRLELTDELVRIKRLESVGAEVPFGHRTKVCFLICLTGFQASDVSARLREWARYHELA
jgi:hypothetical protein